MKEQVEGKVIQLSDYKEMNGDWASNAQEFADTVKRGEVTHGVMIYRDQQGDVHWRVFNSESGTYALGLLSRLSHLINAYGLKEE
jgi:hypothetical protein